MPEAQNLREVVERWRADGLVFLRHDAPKIVVIIVVSAALILILRTITHRLSRFSRLKVPGALRAQQLRTMAGVSYSVGVAVICFVALLQILPVFGINMGPLLASAGIAGLAIGFGAQTLVKDVINGFFILLENQYDVGDTVRIAGVTGVVEGMTLRRTLLRDAEGALSTVPNSEIHVVSNLTRDWAQVSLHVAVAYNESSDRVMKVLHEVLAEFRSDPQYTELVVGDPQVPGIERVTSGEVDYLILVKTRPGQQYAVSRELRRRIKECLEKNNIQPGGPARVYVAEPGPK